MKEKTSKLLLIILLFGFIQACSSNQPKPLSHHAKQTKVHATEMQALAESLGKAEVDDVFISKASSGAVQTEYRIIGTYTAASGRQCKEARINADNAEQASGVVCQSDAGHWYWPRKIIFK